MHTCPRCGMECDCSGDWDDTHVMSDAWVWKNCECECEQFQDENDPVDDDDDPEYYQCLACHWDGDYDPGHCPRCGGYTISGVY